MTLIIQAHLKPNSRHRQEVVEDSDGSFTIYVKSPAIEGRANKEAVELLAKYFKVSKSRVELVRGEKSKCKVFRIDALEPDEQ